MESNNTSRAAVPRPPLLRDITVSASQIGKQVMERSYNFVSESARLS